MHNIPIVLPILAYDGFIFRNNEIVLLCNSRMRLSVVLMDASQRIVP